MFLRRKCTQSRPGIVGIIISRTETGGSLQAPVRYGDLKAGLDSVHAALNVVEMGLWSSDLMNEVINEKRTAQFVRCLESLVKAVLLIESKIDPTGETRSFDDDVAIAFLTKIEADVDEDLGAIWNLRSTARMIRERLKPKEEKSGRELSRGK